MFSQFVVVAGIGGELENQRDDLLDVVAESMPSLPANPAHGLEQEEIRVGLLNRQWHSSIAYSFSK